MKLYSIISIIFISLLTLFVYINSNDTTTFIIFGEKITLLNAVWSAIFLSLFFIISYLYFVIQNFKIYLFKKSLKKDKENLIKNIESRVLYQEAKYPIKHLKEINSFIMMINGDKIEFQENETFPIFKELQNLQKNNEADLSKYKLSKNNPWILKLLEIKAKKGDIQATKELLKTPLKEEGVKLLTQNGDVKQILANNYEITKELILKNLDSNRLKELIEKSKLKNQEYIEIARKLYQTTTNPDTLLELFKSKKVAYIYLLIEYEMIDKAFEEAKENGVKLFEYYLLLRKAGIKIDIKEFINAKL